MTMKNAFAPICLALAALGTALHAAPAQADAALRAAIAQPQRTPAFVARDAARHPYETLSFFGIKPEMTVVELAPGGGWYTEILAPYLRDKGKLILGADDPASDSAYAKRSIERLQQKLAAQPAVFDKVQLGVFDAARGKLVYAAPGTVDLVLTFRNVHNWAALGEAPTQAVFKSAFTALKPGGVLGVVDHRLPAARTQDEKASSGYLHEAWVIRVAESAGFKLAAKSEVNANPKDTADHENGVWALPPTWANKDKDRARYEAIGESDRMTLRFVKPS
ncbi:methyltransferase [Paucibacter sp. APW11]|uniref:Methyltransferase n=1 Tax=Roseateles aquae TaxID=3077235 RepID=A0ABU3PBU7_9BURK|nr:methyltransferase [Paucibacter sp. APW11]MDT8999787.1 methyltransferase [Paucibacter sp. APW11]